MMDAKKLLTTVAGPDGVSNAVKFDGVSDYLARGGALTGVVDSGSFVFSCWVRRDRQNADVLFLYSNSPHFSVQQNTSSETFSPRLNANLSDGTLLQPYSLKTYARSHANWFHFLVSISLSSGSAHWYINDEYVALTGMTTTGALFRFASYTFSLPSSSGSAGCALQHLYFAPGEYLDLSVEANRRKFCDYDASGQLVPVSLGADGSAPTGSQPAIYLPLTDPLSAGLNLGYGGNFTVNGALEYASTSPDTPSVEAVDTQDIDGNAIRRSTSLAGVADSKKFVLSGWFWHTPGEYQQTFCQKNTASGSDVFAVDTGGTGNNKFRFFVRDAAGTLLVNTTATEVDVPRGRWFHLLVSADFSANTLDWYVDGIMQSHSVTLVNGNVNFSGTDFSVPGRWNHVAAVVQNPIDGVSEFFFAPGHYIDLSVEENRRKFITADGRPANPRQLHTATGINPAIYLPNPAATVEQNLGYGGDFTRNGTLKDARSTPLYYYAEPATFDGVNDYLSRSSALIGVVDSASGTLNVWFKLSGGDGTQQAIFDLHDGSASMFYLCRLSSNVLNFIGRSAMGSNTFVSPTSETYLAGSGWHHFVASFDGATGAIKMYVDDIDVTPAVTVDNIAVKFTSANQFVGSQTSGGSKFNGDLAELFFAPGHYIDLSVEENRRKFITADGRPAGNLIETTGITPAIYLARDPDNFHKNLGSGGDFTVNGALARGINSPSDVKEVV